LNVRAEPRIQGTIVGTLRRGERVKLVGVSGDGYWYKILGSRGLTGWSSHKFLAPVIASGAVVADDFPWLPIALAEQGVKEYPGDGDNPRIVEYLQSTALEAPMRTNDETIAVLGGNQSDEVNQANRPKADLLGYRLPANLV
jgi:uncharacterized protein YgiM (DUF1202 family)